MVHLFGLADPKTPQAAKQLSAILRPAEPLDLALRDEEAGERLNQRETLAALEEDIFGTHGVCPL